MGRNLRVGVDLKVIKGEEEVGLVRTIFMCCLTALEPLWFGVSLLQHPY